MMKPFYNLKPLRFWFSFNILPAVGFPVPDVGCFSLFIADISPRAVSQDIVNLANEQDNSAAS